MVNISYACVQLVNVWVRRYSLPSHAHLRLAFILMTEEQK